MSRIPARFLNNKSKVKGVDLSTFLKKEEELEEMFQSGYFGYSGLVGGSGRRPSELVEKIIETLRGRERELRRKDSNQSSITMWTNSATPNINSKIPARFRVMDPKRPTFEAIVEQVTKSRPSPILPTKSFKSLAKSVLSPENRQWRQLESNRTQERWRRLNLGGKSFLMDDEGNELPEEENAEVGDVEELDRGSSRRKLVQQDSLLSLNSSMSVESDWSDDEDGELEKIFGVMSEKGEEYAKLRQIRRLRRKSRRAGSSRMSGSVPGTPSTTSWDGNRLVYSRESSISGMNTPTQSIDRLDHDLPLSNLVIHSYQGESEEVDLIMEKAELKEDNNKKVDIFEDLRKETASTKQNNISQCPYSRRASGSYDSVAPRRK